MVHQLAYISVSEIDDLAHEIDSILECSRRNNAACEVTGVLIFAQSMFLQLLEGDQTVLAETYERIARDPRHEDVTPLMSRDVAQRRFNDWSMGWHRVPDAHPGAERIRSLGHPDSLLSPGSGRDDEIESLIESFFALNQI